METDRKYMSIDFKILKIIDFEIENIVNCAFDLSDIINIEFNKADLYFFKFYGKKGWLKQDIIQKIKGQQLRQIHIDYSSLNECTDILLELKFKKEVVLDISFGQILDGNYNIRGYLWQIYRIGQQFNDELIFKIANCIKKYLHAKDTIKLIKDREPYIRGSDLVVVEFKEF